MTLPVHVRTEVLADLREMRQGERNAVLERLADLGSSFDVGEVLRLNESVRVLHAGRYRIFYSVLPTEAPDRVLVLAIGRHRAGGDDAYAAVAQRERESPAPKIGTQTGLGDYSLTEFYDE